MQVIELTKLFLARPTSYYSRWILIIATHPHEANNENPNVY